MRKIKFGFKKLTNDAQIPTRAHETDSGFDLYASEDILVEPGETKLVKTGIAIELPEGFEAQVRPRSGVTLKTKLRVQLGTIDNDYRGEIGIIVDNIETDKTIGGRNLSGEVIDEIKCSYGAYQINRGDRIAQLVIQSLPEVEAYEIKEELSYTSRGTGGFGSTGTK